MLKKSKFNIGFQKENCYFLYNSHTGSFVTLNEDFQKSASLLNENKLEAIPSEHLSKFKEAGFVIESEKNEDLLYRFLTNQNKYSNDYLGLTIATTLQCNFRCPYCYEEHLDSFFNEEKEAALVNFIKENLEGKKGLGITWYGGEPLLQREMIDRTSQKLIELCEERNIEYYADMVSNGYLLSREVAENMVNNNKVKSVQITLDGGPETHNLTRILRNGQGSFDKIIENIKNICDLINVTIRVNVSKNNVEDIHKLFPILLENGLNKKVGVYFSPVTNSDQACQSVTESCLRTEEFSDWEMKLIEYADNLGFYMGNMYPINFRGKVCTAVTSNNFVIDSEGDLYKCWNEVGKQNLKCGTLTKGITNNDRYMKWVEWFYPEKCTECSILPLCQGRCPDLSLDGSDFECLQLKYNIVERLYRFYKQLDQDKVLEKQK